MANNLDEEIEQNAPQAPDGREKQEFDSRQQQDRLSRTNNPSTIEKAADTIETVKKYSKWARRLAYLGEFLAATAPVTIPLSLAFFFAATFVAGCNNSVSFRVISLGICEHVMIGNITPVPTTIAPASGTGELNIVITSAYRPGAKTIDGKLSAHGRGEAVDISIRPRLPVGSTDARITQLVAIAKAAGFTPSRGDTLNEYARPQCNASDGDCAGHVHVEFNTKADGTTYCDNTNVPSPPTDLVNLSDSGIPFEGISAPNQPKVRFCMLSAVVSIFNAAGIGP